jgi:hypothetical protein
MPFIMADITERYKIFFRIGSTFYMRFNVMCLQMAGIGTIPLFVRPPAIPASIFIAHQYRPVN